MLVSLSLRSATGDSLECESEKKKEKRQAQVKTEERKRGGTSLEAFNGCTPAKFKGDI